MSTGSGISQNETGPQQLWMCLWMSSLSHLGSWTPRTQGMYVLICKQLREVKKPLITDLTPQRTMSQTKHPALTSQKMNQLIQSTRKPKTWCSSTNVSYFLLHPSQQNVTWTAIRTFLKSWSAFLLASLEVPGMDITEGSSTTKRNSWSLWPSCQGRRCCLLLLSSQSPTEKVAMG